MKKISVLSVNFLFVLLLLGITGKIAAQQLVLPGDNPDPSVAKIGNTWWASATTSNWAPVFPLYQSKDLIHWKETGSVFKEKPEWADYYFWAPEISYDNNKVYIYYTAHKRDGNLCVGVASADKPEGPYTDHGPLICQEDGSIDAFPMRDENGKLYLIWKEDGNSIGRPTPIWISEMNEERTALTGEKRELFRNTEPWEANLVEGVSMIRHGDYFYAFYAAAGCCGIGCTYQTGIARSRSLLGPWEKYNKNPVMTGNAEWKCPGHGTPVQKGDKFYFLYHSYNTKSTAYAGRQGMLQEFTFTPDGWIKFIDGPVSKSKTPVPAVLSEDFKGHSLDDKWQWSIFNKPDYSLNKGALELSASNSLSGSYVAVKTYTADYTADAVIRASSSDAQPGIGLIGDERNIVIASLAGDTLRLSVNKNGKPAYIEEKTVRAKDRLWLRVQVREGKTISLFYSTDGKVFNPFNSEPVDGAFLPPWDRAVRIGLTAKGQAGQKAVFESFKLTSRE